jgi:hypothetical protein
VKPLPPPPPPTLFEQLAALSDGGKSDFLDANWQGLKEEAGGDLSAGAKSAYFFDNLFTVTRPSLALGQVTVESADPFPFLATVINTINNLPHKEPVNGTLAESFSQPTAKSFTGGLSSAPSASDSVPTTRGKSSVSSEPVEEQAENEPPPIPVGVNVLMAEDTTLRLADHQLLENGALTSESLQFAELGEASHGRVWLDDNGDIRFQPDADLLLRIAS